MNDSHGASGCTYFRAGAAVAILGLTLAGCGGTSPEIAKMTCPEVVPAPGTETIVLFRPGGHSAQDVMVTGKVYSANIRCQHEKAGVAALTELTFYAERSGPRILNANLPYFVAVVGPSQKVLAQEAFDAHVAFLPGEPYRRLPAEKITVHLPVRNTASASDYSIVVGFQLTPEQLAYNRSAGLK